jgi:hypothetical protein
MSENSSIVKEGFLSKRGKYLIRYWNLEVFLSVFKYDSICFSPMSPQEFVLNVCIKEIFIKDFVTLKKGIV